MVCDRWGVGFARVGGGVAAMAMMAMGDERSAGGWDGLDVALRLARDDRTHGASWLAREVARALADATRPVEDGVGGASERGARALERLRGAHEAARALAGARPTMVALANCAARVWAAGCDADAAGAAEPEARLARLHAEARRLLRVWEEATKAISAAASGVLQGRLFTLSRSGTVEATLLALARTAAEAGAARREVVVAESRPGGEGVGLAQALARGGWEVTLVADAACGLFVGEVDAVVIGADSVRADGSVVNKVGSYPLALAARAAGKPVYALCETLKIAATDAPLVLEGMEPQAFAPEPTPGLWARNPLFERTPAGLIAGVMTEEGALDGAGIAARAAVAARMLRLLDAGGDV